VSEDIVQVRKLRDRGSFLAHLASLGIDLPLADQPGDPDGGGSGGALARPLVLSGPGLDGRRLGNRWAVLPMEGWDGTDDGRPTDLVRRRWRRFGESGAKLIWGGEAVAVVPEGRANPHQLCIGPSSVDDLASLRAELVDAHTAAHGDTGDLVVGLQLTHSGRWARPFGEPAPRVAYRHPLLDDRVGVTDSAVLSDDELDELVGRFVAAAGVAAAAGFDFVDVKQCHGYLLHELLSGVDRPGRYGGDLDGRSRFVRSVVEGVVGSVPGIGVATRLSVFDLVPHGPDAHGVGVPLAGPIGEATGYRYAFGGDGRVDGIDPTEVDGLLGSLRALGVSLVCTTAGSPYYTPHAQRPAYFPPSDGYLPPHDPLVDVATMVAATARLARAHPDLTAVGSGLSYLQEWLPAVAEALVADGSMAMAGIGRMVLSYPTLPADVLAGRPLRRSALCRTFSDCTTAPRHGLVSGCYPLDELYKQSPQRVELTRAKREAEAARGGRRR
jgi:2,4-dienoyl-CoA reductase-like NADH-dependent reductase (Old Yellow Enzyme family)